jgi:hypothetical protein
MSSQNTIPETQDSTGSNNTTNRTTYNCAASVYCQLPLVNFADSPHKCYFCKGTLHGPCGVLHDPDSITFHNRCNYCDRKFCSHPQVPSRQPALQSPPPESICKSSVVVMSTNEMLSRLTSNSRTSTPTSTCNSQNLDAEDPFLDDCNVHAVGESECVDNTPIPEWFALNIDEIYEKLNLRTKQGQVYQRAWCK